MSEKMITFPYKKEPELPEEEIERLKGEERKQLFTSLINIRELDPKIYQDGLNWLIISVQVEDESFDEGFEVAYIRFKQLQDKYPKHSSNFNSEFQRAQDLVKRQSFFMHDVILPQLRRLYELDGSQVFTESYQNQMLPDNIL